MSKPAGPCRKCGGAKPPGRGRKYCDDCAPSCIKHGAQMRGCRDCQKVWTYSISGEQLNVLLEDAECATCGSKERLCIDHDHVTGKVRGMLCDDCNLALGKVKDSIDTLTRMVEYLKFSATGQ